MKPSKQRKMLRAIEQNKARKRSDKQAITNKHLKVWAEYDVCKNIRYKMTAKQRERARWI